MSPVWILYFCCYISNLEDERVEFDLGGRMIISQDSIDMYLYPVGYVKWKIDMVETELEPEAEYLFTGIYHVSNGSTKSIIQISGRNIMQLIFIKHDSTAYVIQSSVRRTKTRRK